MTERTDIKKSSPWFKGGLLISMYMCQTISLGYVFGSLPVIMRQQNMSLKSIGMLFILHLPWAFKFLWARFVDSKYLDSLGRRRSWIFPLQWLSVAILLLLSLFPPEENFAVMYLLVFLLHLAMATNDIAVDGYATDMLLTSEREWGNVIQSGSRFAGLILGGGLMLSLHESLGWSNLCIILGVSIFILSLPVLLHEEIQSVYEINHEEENSGVISFLRRKEIRNLLIILILPTAFMFTSIQMRTPLLTDLGMTTTDIGKIMMSWGYPIGLAGTVASGWLLKKLRERAFVATLIFIAVFINAYTINYILAGSITTFQAIIILSTDNILVGGIHVWAYTKMMKASEGGSSGTGFALLSSLFIIVPIASAPLFGNFGDKFGFFKLYSMLLVFIIIGYLLSCFMQRIRKEENIECKLDKELI